MEAKYICGELPAAVGTCYGAVIFPAFMSHAEVARALRIKPTSAGMCRTDDNGWIAYGESTSLRVASKPDDERQLDKLGRD